MCLMDRNSFQGVYLPYTKGSQDRPQIPHDPEDNKAGTEYECLYDGHYIQYNQYPLGHILSSTLN